jgi:hypothetical protein
MSQQLLLEARKQAEQSQPEIRAVAMVHIARVLGQFHRAEAERMLDTGLEANSDFQNYSLERREIEYFDG